MILEPSVNTKRRPCFAATLPSTYTPETQGVPSDTAHSLPESHQSHTRVTGQGTPMVTRPSTAATESSQTS